MHPVRERAMPGPLRLFTRGQRYEPEHGFQAFFDELRPLSLIRRLIEADEIGSLVTYLASPLAAVTNGAAIRAEGGIIPTIA